MIINKLFNSINKITFHNLIFLSPHLYSIGNYSEILMYGLMKAKLTNKKIFLLAPYNSKFLFSKRFCNPEILKLESEYIYNQNFILFHLMKLSVTLMIIPSRSLDRIKNLTGKLLDEEKVVPLVGFDDLWCTEKEKKSVFSWDVADKYLWHNQIEIGYDLDINAHKSKFAKNLLSEIGIDFSTWYVCVHVRESGFRDDKNRREYRNSTISNYIPAIKVITDAGGIVVRMGDSSMTKLPKLPNVIDYPFSSKKSALLDLYLVKHCRFYLGTDSGLMDVAEMFLKDTVLTNMVHWMFVYPLRRKDRGIYKHVYSKSHGRYLTFNEVLSAGWELQNVFGDIDDNYVLTENTSDDIKLAVSEYLKCHSHNDFSLTKRQLYVNNERVFQAREIYDHSNLRYDSNILKETLTKYRVSSRVSIHTQGSICESYLEKYLYSSFS